jgi:hypothetical protein
MKFVAIFIDKNSPLDLVAVSIIPIILMLIPPYI